MTFWIGEQWQKEFKQLNSVYFHSKDKGQMLGRISKDYSNFKGTGAFFNNKHEVIVSTFKNGKPNGATLTYLVDGNIKYSFFSDGVEEVLY